MILHPFSGQPGNVEAIPSAVDTFVIPPAQLSRIFLKRICPDDVLDPEISQIKSIGVPLVSQDHS